MIKEKLKIIIDTDNGDDIDDLITLYFALENKNIEILGIVCSYLNAPLRVKQIEHVLKLFNRQDIPVYCGMSKPYKTIHPQPLDTIYCQYGPELENDVKKEDGMNGVNFLIESAKKYGNELIILEVAPETTLAKAIEVDKDAFKNTRIVIMGGAFYKNEPEWNIECDYQAADIVLNSGLDLTYVGLDVTDLSELKESEYENLLLQPYENKKLAYLSLCSNRWVNCSKRHIVLHDPLTLLTLIYDDLCEFKDEYVTIVHDEINNRYYTTITNNKNDARVKVASKLDRKKLLDDIYVNILRRLDINE